MSDNNASELENFEPNPGSIKPDPILKIDNIVRSFGGLRAVDIDHLEVQRGIITAFIGPNGAGKTTLFNLITGFDKADSGKWTFHQLAKAQSFATDLSGLRPYQIANKGMVRTFQLTKSLAKMTVLDNMLLGAPEQRGELLRYALVPTKWKKQEQQVLQKAEALLEKFNLSHMRDEYAATLSGGQRKRAFLARAIAQRASVLLLDEPFSGVDVRTEKLMSELFLQFSQEGRTILISTHDLNHVRDF
ncbi:MAG: ABC transporter ATP-binding protein, partial [Acidimicrobiaceae bacterium]|nr:ABC transporter ATP-binding protein [Acidimicrobiaceae bacterium]